MKKLSLLILFSGLVPLWAIAGHPSVQWSYPLGELAAVPQVFADDTGGALLLHYVGTDKVIVWLDNDGDEVYRKVFHENDGFGYVVAVSRENIVLAIESTQSFMVVNRRGSESIIPNSLGATVVAPMAWGDDKGFFTVRDAAHPSATLVRYRFR